MYIKIETTDIEHRKVTSKKDGVIYHIATQPALLFKDADKYPYHFALQLAFTSDEAERDSKSALGLGDYQLIDQAWSIDNFSNVQVTINPQNLKQTKTASMQAVKN